MSRMTFTQPIPTICRDGDGVLILDQTLLPHRCETRHLATLDEVATAIRTMQVRGAPLIGATAAFGLAIALRQDTGDTRLAHAIDILAATRPTAVNLHWALARMDAHLRPLAPAARLEAAWAEAEAIRHEDAETCVAIGRFGVALLQEIAARRDGAVRVMTHCNAGWVATLGPGTALAPIYAAHAQGLPVHVWVSETRPRNQGLLTAWELHQAGVPHSLITDNAAGLLMARGDVDIVITGARSAPISRRWPRATTTSRSTSLRPCPPSISRAPMATRSRSKTVGQRRYAWCRGWTATDTSPP